MRIFRDNLQESMKPEVQAFWTCAYRLKFAGIVAIEDCQHDMDAQRIGIDRRVRLQSGRVLAFDEKIRSESFPDFAIEYQHVYRNGYIKPGWVGKTLAIDYIAYGILPEKRVYWLPYDLLCDAWRVHSTIWLDLAQARKQGFFISKSPNPDYTTFNCCVPRNVLLTAITAATEVDFDSSNPYDESDPEDEDYQSLLREHVGDDDPFSDDI